MSKDRRCDACRGTGYDPHLNPWSHDSDLCLKCRGTGRAPTAWWMVELALGVIVGAWIIYRVVVGLYD